MTICHVYMTMCQSVLDHTFYFSCYFSHNQPGLQSYQLKGLFAIRSHLLVGLQGQDSLWPGIFGLFCTYPACIQIIQARRYRLHPNYTSRQQLGAPMCDKTIAFRDPLVHSRAVGQQHFDTYGYYCTAEPVPAGVQKNNVSPPHTQWHITEMIQN